MKKFLTSIIFLLLVASFMGCNNDIKIKKNAEEYIDRPYEEVLEEFHQLGFQDIETIELADLTSYGDRADRAVGEVSINGNTEFTAKTVFPKNTKIIITYHTIKKLSSPIPYHQVSEMKYTEIADAFIKAGFSNVQTKELYDLDPDETNDTYQNEIQINSTTFLEDSQLFPFDANVNVICHYPFEKYDVVLTIDFLGNFFFSKYDVDFFIDGTLQDTLKHGTDWKGNIRLKKGEHTITFSKKKTSSVYGEIILNVTDNTAVSYQISCNKKEVAINTLSLEQKVELANNNNSPEATEKKETQKPEKETANTTEQKSTKQDLEKNTDGTVTTDKKISETTKDNDTKKEENKELTKAALEELVINQACSTVRSLIKDMEYTAEYEHEYTHMDFTGEIDYHSDKELDDLGFIITGVKQINNRKKVVTLYVNTTDNIERINNQKNLRTTLEKNFDPSVALATLEQYGKILYPAGFSLDMITGQLAETPIDENTWFMKYTCKITNASGEKISMTCEAKIEGPEANPNVYDFYVY